MPHDSKYCQFPISVLQVDWKDSTALVSDIIDLAAHHLASQPVDEEPVPWMAERFAERTGCEYEFEEDEERYMAAFEYLGGSFSDRTAAAYMQRNAEVVQRHTRDAPGFQCRLRLDIAKDATRWPVNRLRVLIALYAGIGRDRYKWLTYSRIAQLAAGCGPAVLSEKAVRNAVEYLWVKNFVQSVTQKNRRLYSNKFASDKALAQYIRSLNSRTQNRKAKIEV